MMNLYAKEPTVVLVGAGPGDPELLTLKAIKELKKAKVVLYDSLIDTSILEYAENAEKFFVGKRKGYHSYSQDEINTLLLRCAIEYNYVVRLKGGDPFVFGRGKEEITFLESHGIKTSVVPGISSAIAAPGSIGIPVTQRGFTESFWVITGTTSNGEISKDIESAATSKATVVILMGMSKLSQIISIYKSNNRSNYPIAIVQNGTKSEEKHITGTIETIENIANEEQISTPAVIIIGEVVKSYESVVNCVNQCFLEDEFVYQNLNIEPQYE
ncbi:uroporphyrinogen-III C-methyltransferase [Tenacibaculum xiamenense]|uniref:uroporphyrinogen-III C-methyltransferase n=1 Tax=Tenacibaculum xiamenense TaxID=1261553 RepID=UPI0038945797